MDIENKVENDDESSSVYEDKNNVILNIRFNKEVLDGSYYKVVLDVPYIHKEIAKENKCRFDGELKKWYYNIKEPKNFKNKDVLFNFELYNIIGLQKTDEEVEKFKKSYLSYQKRYRKGLRKLGYE